VVLGGLECVEEVDNLEDAFDDAGGTLLGATWSSVNPPSGIRRGTFDYSYNMHISTVTLIVMWVTNIC